MYRFILMIITIIFVLSMPSRTNAQFFDKLKKNIEKKVEGEAESRTNKKADEAVDKAFDSAEDAITGDKTENNKNEQKPNQQNGDVNSQSTGNQNGNTNNVHANAKTMEEKKVVWSKFDFVPGDKVIFEDEPSADEENGEFPSRWDLAGGSAEIAEFGGEPVIMFIEGGSIIPYLKNSNQDYLPDVYTIEFDAYFTPGENIERYWVYLSDNKNQDIIGFPYLDIYVNGLSFDKTDKRYPGTEKFSRFKNPVGGWKHISIAFTKGKFKAYMDDTRLINIPHLEKNPTGLTIKANNNQLFVKNIRIAAGGVKYYDRVLSDGKIIVNGIKFDVDKATLKPESMGPINKIYKLMKKNPDLKFSVEGHTDSDGEDTHNMELSKARAKTVMDKLIEMGISPDRLKYTGFGESKPIDTNGTAEGKANNRRVEFVKF